MRIAADFVLGPDDEPQYSGAVVAVNYCDYRRKLAGRRGTRSDKAEQRFRDFLQGIGAELLEDQWLGAMYKHRAKCAEGHECEVTPNSVDRPGRRGICRVCARQDPAMAEAAFRQRVASLGGTVLEPAWLGSAQPHRVRCVAGHETAPTPGSVTKGQGICGPCAGNDRGEALRQFHKLVAEFGATVVDDAWRGVDAPHAVKCEVGHVVQVRSADLKRAQSLCAVCRGRTPAIVEARFRGRVSELGGEVLEPTWLGSNAPHRVRCRVGHVVTPRPDHVLGGSGMCHICAGRSWDVFYVVTNAATSTLKFGITSGNPRPRLADHAHSGFRQVDLLLTALGDGIALIVERSVRADLRAAGYRPVQGSEYFHACVRESVFVAAANVLARGPVTLLNRGDEATYMAGWRNGRKDLADRMEPLIYEYPREMQ